MDFVILPAILVMAAVVAISAFVSASRVMGDAAFLIILVPLAAAFIPMMVFEVYMPNNLYAAFMVMLLFTSVENLLGAYRKGSF